MTRQATSRRTHNNGIAVVLCHYYLSPAELHRLLDLFAGYPSVERIVVVSNGKHALELSDRGATAVSSLRGSNSLYDFSAYCEGVASLDAPPGRRGVLFVNDSIFRKYPYRWVIAKVLADALLYPDLPAPLAVGFSGSYDFFLTANPWSGARRHLCTACFYLNTAGSRLMLELVEGAKGALPAASPSADGDEVPGQLRALCGDRFFGYLSLLHFSAQTGVWAPEFLEESEASALAKKAVCFYLEHRISAEIENRGGGLIFINRGKRDLVFRSLLAVSRRLPRYCNPFM